jgi:hypothetical protein
MNWYRTAAHTVLHAEARWAMVHTLALWPRMATPPRGLAQAKSGRVSQATGTVMGGPG